MPAILSIVADAQAFLASRGVNQWQDGYPNETFMTADIERGDAYVFERDGAVLGIASIVFDGEPTYDHVYGGAWTTPEPFACVHRVAVGAGCRGTGVADALMAACDGVIRERGLSSVRIDTHPDNLVMQRVLARNGFRRCGEIKLLSGAMRLALEKHLP